MEKVKFFCIIKCRRPYSLDGWQDGGVANTKNAARLIAMRKLDARMDVRLDFWNEYGDPIGTYKDLDSESIIDLIDDSRLDD